MQKIFEIIVSLKNRFGSPSKSVDRFGANSKNSILFPPHPLKKLELPATLIFFRVLVNFPILKKEIIIFL